jgi:16S rRNA (cytidine1402-2'-O)-methyltransferase
MNKGILYLIPTTLGKTPSNNSLPEYTLEIIRTLDTFAVENIQSAVKFLQWVGRTVPEYNIEFYSLNKKTPEQEVFSLLKPLKAGKNMGILSEAGAPAIADPGSTLVKMAHRNGIQVVPLVGPSSILLAMMASGFNGQSFSFHGYLPMDQKGRKQTLIQLEGESQRHNRSQIFMEAPYRNNQMLKTIIDSCQSETKLCIATDITLQSERIVCKKISEWKNEPLPDLHKRPTIFILYAK